mmetsp:Transcript_36146/g.116085  ORF Transcript_36146/g.116085 Transcript_36146/m.116085 type:complete len:247 (-) Transcript_36146:72-812(-)
MRRCRGSAMTTLRTPQARCCLATVELSGWVLDLPRLAYTYVPLACPRMCRPPAPNYEWYASFEPFSRSELRLRNPYISAMRTRLELAAAPPSSGGGKGGYSLTPADDVDVSQLDSIQIIGHGEYFAKEYRHEIVMIDRAECSPLDGALVVCGRHPHLFPCGPEALARITRCSSMNKNLDPKIARVVRPKAERNRRSRCRIDRNTSDPAVATASLAEACYLNGDAIYMCPQPVVAAAPAAAMQAAVS